MLKESALIHQVASGMEITGTALKAPAVRGFRV
jgi:hypothetical protein